MPPFTFSSFDKPTITSSGEPTFEVVTLRCQFQAPPQAGEYKFQMHVLSDSFIGFDVKQDIDLIVEDADKVDADVDEEDEISEPEEDSIAGQMASLRGLPTKEAGTEGEAEARQARRDRRRRELESEDESDTEGEEDEEEESETDTDTSDDEA